MNYLKQLMFCPMCSKDMTLSHYESHGCLFPKIPCQNIIMCSTADISAGDFVKEEVCSPACLLMQMRLKGRSQKEILQGVHRLSRDPRVLYTVPK